MTAHHFPKTRKTIWNTMPERDKRSIVIMAAVVSGMIVTLIIGITTEILK